MDYVLFGMGYGATLMLLGWALRTFGPEQKYKDVNPEDIDQTILQRRWVRFIQGLGGVIAISGTAFVLFTFVIMLVNPDDETGAFTSMVIWGFLTVAILIWCWFYVASYGTTGVWSRQSGYRAWQPSGISGTDKVLSRSRVRSVAPADTLIESESVIDQGSAKIREQNAAIDSDSIEDATKVEPGYDEAEDVGSDEDIESGAVAESVVEELEDSDPEYDFGDGTDTTVPSEFGGRSEAIRRLRDRQAQSGNSSNHD